MCFSSWHACSGDSHRVWRGVGVCALIEMGWGRGRFVPFVLCSWHTEVRAGGKCLFLSCLMDGCCAYVAKGHDNVWFGLQLVGVVSVIAALSGGGS